MKTAVEWLVEHLNLDETSPNYNKLIINKAKEMEKEQIINACKQCSYSYEEAEQYYNETFKSEQNANNKPNPFSLSMESYGLHIKIQLT